MTRLNDGGPAFPVPTDPRRPNIRGGGAMDGMSLRDWFAGQTLAMGGTLLHSNSGSGYTNELAKWCYKVADAMLKAREENANAP